MSWENLDRSRPESAHYSVLRKQSHIDGMNALREMFPEAKANELNFVLFSTSGVHATYNLIEEAEAYVKGDDKDGLNEVAFVIVHPRLVALRYGVVSPITPDDFAFLKALRASSHEVMLTIGMPAPSNAEVKPS